MIGNKEVVWAVAEQPGYLGSRKEEKEQEWNNNYGVGNWRIRWRLENGQFFDYSDIFYKIYVPGYASYFADHPLDAIYLTKHFAYGYDKDPVTKEQAFDPYFLFEKPKRPNQFHNVALNIALEYHRAIPFEGIEPIQIREGKPESDPEGWPLGWKWTPGRIPTTRPDLIPSRELFGWWSPGSVEDLYQKAKVLQVRIP